MAQAETSITNDVDIGTPLAICKIPHTKNEKACDLCSVFCKHTFDIGYIKSGLVEKDGTKCISVYIDTDWFVPYFGAL